MSTSGKTLSQAALDVGVEPSTIKYWCEEFSNFIRPARTPGGHRRFSDGDIHDLCYLRQLLHKQNFSIKQAKDYLNQTESLPTEVGTVKLPAPQQLTNTPSAAANAQEMGRYLAGQIELIASAQLQAMQAALEQTAAAVLDEVRELDSARFAQWGHLVEHTASKTNENVLAAVDAAQRSPQEIDEVKRMYAEARDRWLTEEAKVRMEIQRLRHELEDIQNHTFWQRLRWALFGRGKGPSEADTQHNPADPIA